MNIITRKEARAQGLTYYFTGKPCKYGHYSKRYVGTRNCAQCQLEHERRYYSDKPEYRSKRKEKAKKEYRMTQADPAKRQEHLERLRVRSRMYYAANAELCKRRAAESRIKKLSEYKKRAVIHAANKLKNDSLYKLQCTLRRRILIGVKRAETAKRGSTRELLGCSYHEARAHLEALFLPGMTWDNHGAWHIDHIIPCAAFDLTVLEQQRRCFHYSNLQPLWARDNLSKGDRLDWANATLH